MQEADGATGVGHGAQQFVVLGVGAGVLRRDRLIDLAVGAAEAVEALVGGSAVGGVVADGGQQRVAVAVGQGEAGATDVGPAFLLGCGGCPFREQGLAGGRRRRRKTLRAVAQPGEGVQVVLVHAGGRGVVVDGADGGLERPVGGEGDFQPDFRREQEVLEILGFSRVGHALGDLAAAREGVGEPLAGIDRQVVVRQPALLLPGVAHAGLERQQGGVGVDEAVAEHGAQAEAVVEVGDLVVEEVGAEAEVGGGTEGAVVGGVRGEAVLVHHLLVLRVEVIGAREELVLGGHVGREELGAEVEGVGVAFGQAETGGGRHVPGTGGRGKDGFAGGASGNGDGASGGCGEAQEGECED